MTDKNITVIIRQSWVVVTFAIDDQGEGECIDDHEFEDYEEALLCATYEAKRRGADVTHGWVG